MDSDIPVRDAASVLLVRDGETALEVLMVRRHAQTVFGAGKYVFPGGAVDPADRGKGVQSLCGSFSDAQASQRLGLASGGLAFWVAAVRECFEEAGLLLALDSSGDYPSWRAGSEPPALQVYRKLLMGRGQASFSDMCLSNALTIAADRLAYFSHWVTPPGPPRRFSARFFIARAPRCQTPSVDGEEVVEYRWLSPRRALQCHEAGEIGLMLPTRAQLDWLANHATVEAALAAAARGDVKTVAPDSAAQAARDMACR